VNRISFLLVLGVICYVIAFPPLDLGPIGCLALVAFGLAFQREKMGWKGWVLTYTAGVCLFAFGCAWLTEVNLAFVFFAALPEGLALVLFALVYRVLRIHAAHYISNWIALPISWVAVEYLRSVFPLDGFPWLILGYTLWRIPPLIQIADVTGVYGVSFLMAMAAGLILSWIHCLGGTPLERENKPLVGTWIFCAIMIGICTYGYVRPHALKIEKGPVLAAVQANIPQELKHVSNVAGDVYQRYVDATADIYKNEASPLPDLVVWPETVYPYAIGEGRPGDRWFRDGSGYSRARMNEQLLLVEGVVNRILAPRDAWFLTGVHAYNIGLNGKIEERNGVYLYDTAGKRRDSYFKTIRVPGGEYLPLVDAVPFGDKIRSYALSVAGYLPDLEPGFGPEVMKLSTRERDYLFGVQICYENIYGDYCRRFIEAGAEFLINISNEAWYKTSAEFDQMLAMSVFRAVETRKSLFRSTNTGISCLIDPTGKIPSLDNRIHENGKDRAVQGVLVKEVPLCMAHTLYTRFGDGFAQIVFSIQIFLLGFLFFKNLWVTRRSFSG